MAFDFNQVSGESFGNINDVFFKKNGQSILPQKEDDKSGNLVRVEDIVQDVSDTAEGAKEVTKVSGAEKGQTIIKIAKDAVGEEEESFELTQLEEKRRNTTSVRKKFFIDLNTGDEIQIIEHTEMYDGSNLFTAKHTASSKVITYPRGMFVGIKKRFVPRDFYIREAERSIEDTIDKYGGIIMDIIQDPAQLTETPDGKYLEMVLDDSFDIIGGMVVPDKIQIPVKRMFDMSYKLLMLEYVICVESKIASLLFSDIWF